ncbi:hypothetical protein A1O1_02610 [Capronia coronata CBS 617.96]|uniref:Cyclin N-terminal domain-containing protein n=1 Tax=Capronia coronata CBS 617.96 TaxID=1182541 RepID=W9YMR4_9EURO|nr:uncharacterized protein A1O1_02610 [Capronia coronata CBS 617.96]EXJ94217.1 hypothetical protein A1O1_02610 [Capronia coronata CBS 617.96]
MPGVVLGSSYPDFCSQSYRRGGEPFHGSHHTNNQQPATSTATIGNSYSSSSSASTSLGLYNHRATEQDKTNTIAPHLQIPESVNKSKGSLAEFTAEITCLFWFEDASTLQYAEDLPIDAPVNRGLSSDATPTIGFRKWVTTIISTTQVGRNVILLALMFIYRLKRFNPTVSGKRGSEFRLLTIALMLGNKFLDDNTYTNKTWAEVSGISVNEIHIMEVEFLSNMRYALYASAEEWVEWKAKLGRFGAFYDKASRMPSTDEVNGPAPVTPTLQSFSHKLPSPPSHHHSMSPFGSAPPASLNGQYPKLPHPLPSASQFANSPLRQQEPAPNFPHQGRKRSLDTTSDLPPAKRAHYSAVPPSHGGSLLNPLPYPPNGLRTASSNFNNTPESVPASTSSELRRLEIPRIPTSMALQTGQLAPLSVPVSRAMSSVYPNVNNVYSNPLTPVSTTPQNLFQNPIPSLGDGARPMASYPSSQASPSDGFNSLSPAPTGLSPSYFLTHRSSPYRPVRHVNTLLFPPPSTALQLPVRNIPSDHIHYQPLSKTATEPRSGPVPFMQLDPWQYSNVSTPGGQQQYSF